jgi:hypothetical protein
VTTPPASAAREPRWLPALVFVGLALALSLVGGLAVQWLPFKAGQGQWRGFPHVPWLDGWARWDGGWYAAIARTGYGFVAPLEHGQRPTHFFPLYPLVIRGLTTVLGDALLAGIVTTFAAGLAYVVVFGRWCRRWLTPTSTFTATLVLLLYPFSFFLYGAVYSDALFVLLAVAAFLLLEEDRPVLAGLVGALATATRPVAPAVIVGLCVRLLERRGVLSRPGWRAALRRLRPSDAGVLLCVAGIGIYSAFLYARFGDPVHYLTTMADWGMPAGPDTWFKVYVYRMLREPHWSDVQYLMLANLVPTIAAFALVPAVVRRFGWGYGAYALTALGIAFVNNGDLNGGMGRYILAAFPCFAAAGDLLARRGPARWLVLGFSAAALFALFAAFALWYPVS